MGYKGFRPTVARWIRMQRNATHQDNGQGKTYHNIITPRRLQSWFLKPLQNLPRSATKVLTQVLGAIPELQRGFTLVHQFHTMVRHRAGRALPAWLKAVHYSGILELMRFADSLNKDYSAVYAGLTEPWSQGPVEGINNRLKLIKRMMYGRAKFDLLRKRVIHAQ
jgi:transposase